MRGINSIPRSHFIMEYAVGLNCPTTRMSGTLLSFPLRRNCEVRGATNEISLVSGAGRQAAAPKGTALG